MRRNAACETYVKTQPMIQHLVTEDRMQRALKGLELQQANSKYS